MEENFEDFDGSFFDKNYHYEILNEEKIKLIKKESMLKMTTVEGSENTIDGETERFTNKSKVIDAYNEDVQKPDIIPTSVKIIYSLPSFGKMSCLVILNIHALLYYESIGAGLIYLSFFVSLARACEIVLKPLIAFISDETKSPIGRRKPFMLFGCIFYAVFLVLLFTPPSMRAGATYISLWFGAFYVLFFIADTITNVPYLALGPELSSDTKEREKLYIIFYVFQYIGVLFASAAPVLINRLYSECECNFCDNNPLVTNLEECHKQCQVFCNLKKTRDSLFYMSLVIGVFFVITIFLLGFKVKEKKSSFNKDPKHFLPSLFQVLSNKPFIKLIIPWIIDIMISTTFATMLPFFLNFVINPQKHCVNQGIDLNDDQCSVNVWLGYAISTFFICSIIYMYIWHHLVCRFGKKKCWEMYSLISVLTFSLFLMCEEGSMGTLIFASICCAIPAGGAYLNDVFVSDIIEYDEFLTGKRNEGLYTVFAAFVPKIVSIFSQAIPLAIMSMLGFVSSNNGYAMDQPASVIVFIRIFFIAVPCILALISFCFKVKYPIKSEETLESIKKSIIMQKDFSNYLRYKCDYYKIVDPIYQTYHIQIFTNTQSQKDTKLVVDHFSDIRYLKIIYDLDYKQLETQVKLNIIGSVILLFIFIVTLISTFTFLQNKTLSLIPLLSLFIISISIVILILNIMRYKVVRGIIEGKINIDERFLKLLILKTLSEEEEKKKKVREKEIINSKDLSITNEMCSLRAGERGLSETAVDSNTLHNKLLLEEEKREREEYKE